MSEHIDRYRLEAYVENDLPAAQRRIVEAHVTVCPVCQSRLAAAKQIPALLYGLPSERPSPDLVATINAAVSAQRVPATARWLNASVLAMFVVGFALLAMAAPQWSGWVQAASVVQLPTEQSAAAWLGQLAADPTVMWDSLMALAEQAPTSSVEGMNVLLTLATALLAMAGIAGLAQLLGEHPSVAARKSHT